MNNNTIKISEQILKEFDCLVKKSGVSKQDFLNSIAKLYNIDTLEKNIIDPAAYYDSFTA